MIMDKNKNVFFSAGNINMGVIDDPIRDESDINYENIDPVFSFRSSEFNLKYNKLIPFIGVYLLYCFIMR